MKRWHYAAVASGGVVLLLVGVLIGVSISRSGRTAKPAAVKTPEEEKDDRDLLNALSVLTRPTAKALFLGAGSNSAGELECVTTSKRTELKTPSQVLFSSSSGKEFADARLSLTALQECGLLTPRRTSTDRASGRETVVYALTPRGYQLLDMIKE